MRDPARPRPAAATRSTAPSTTSSDVDDVADRLLAELDPRQLEQVVDRARHAVRLVDHALGDAVHDAEVVLVGQRLGEHGQRPDGRLQLVADVGDEVGAHGVDPPPLADVLDRRHRAAALRAATAATTTATRGGP